jgi:hypothetical protein
VPAAAWVLAGMVELPPWPLGLLGLLQALLPDRLDLGRCGVEEGHQGVAGLAHDRVVAPVHRFSAQPPAGQGDFADCVLDSLGAPALAHQQEQPGGSELMARGVPPVQIGDRALSRPEEEALGAARVAALRRGLGLGPPESLGLEGFSEFSEFLADPKWRLRVLMGSAGGRRGAVGDQGGSSQLSEASPASAPCAPGDRSRVIQCCSVTKSI